MSEKKIDLPIKMTLEELENEFGKSSQFFALFGYYKKGFLLAGGQIIEEPKNLRCQNCGKEPAECNYGTALFCSNRACLYHGVELPRKEWNDPSKRGGK